MNHSHSCKKHRYHEISGKEAIEAGDYTFEQNNNAHKVFVKMPKQEQLQNPIRGMFWTKSESEETCLFTSELHKQQFQDLEEDVGQ